MFLSPMSVGTHTVIIRGGYYGAALALGMTGTAGVVFTNAVGQDRTEPNGENGWEG